MKQLLTLLGLQRNLWLEKHSAYEVKAESHANTTNIDEILAAISNFVHVDILSFNAIFVGFKTPF